MSKKHALYMRGWRIKNKESSYEYQKSYREYNRDYFRKWRRDRRKDKKVLTKHRARETVRRYLKSGTMQKPLKCDCCDTEQYLYGHHESYEKHQWCDVLWLCKECHIEIHKLTYDLEK